MTKTTLSAADLMVICDTLYKSLTVVGLSNWAKETRELTMEKVIVIMENMEADVVHKDVEIDEEDLKND